MNKLEQTVSDLIESHSTLKDAQVSAKLVLSTLHSGSSNNMFFDDICKDKITTTQEKIKHWKEVVDIITNLIKIISFCCVGQDFFLARRLKFSAFI